MDCGQDHEHGSIEIGVTDHGTISFDVTTSHGHHTGQVSPPVAEATAAAIEVSVEAGEPQLRYLKGDELFRVTLAEADALGLAADLRDAAAASRHVIAVLADVEAIVDSVAFDDDPTT